MAVLSWGEPGIYIKKVGDATAKWKKLPTPVEDSTQLSTTKGDKKEAKVEGGANEDVKFAKNTYALTLNIRIAKGRKRPIEDNDGLITENYAIALQPEDKEVEGFIIDKSTVSVEDSWTSADGGILAYTFDALKPDEGNQVKWGVVEVSGTEDNYTVALKEAE